MAKRDYYDVLELKRGADDKEIKRAYRKLAKKFHPDMNPGDQQAEQKFKEITEAYNVLSDAEKKKLYDQYGFAAFEDGFGAGGTYAGGQYNYAGGQGNYAGGQGNFAGGFGKDGVYREFHFSGADMGDMDDIFGDFFGDMFHGHGTGSFSSRKGGGFEYDGYKHGGFGRKGADARADITISFEEAALGCEKVFRLQDEKGRISSIQVHIPAGIDEGQSVRLKGKGASGIGQEADGDLLLTVHIQPKPGYERKGNDVYVTVSIPYTTAALGGEVIVPTLTGKVACKIASGTQPGSKIRLRNKGIPSMKNPAQKGDEYIVIQIEVPKHLTEEERQRLMDYDRACRAHGHSGSAA